MFKLIMFIMFINSGEVKILEVDNIEGSNACNNMKEEMRLAYGAYQLSDLAVEVKSEVCVNKKYGSVE
jgi:hypothetical protein